jgi:hypothetical protein
MNLANIEGRTAWTAAAPLLVQNVVARSPGAINPENASRSRGSAIKIDMKGSNMKTQFLVSTIYFVSLAVLASEQADFSGTWELSPEKSKNIGMMAQMKMSVTVQQSESALDIAVHSNYQGKDQDSKTHLDLTGNPATNESPMGGPNQTVSKWDGNKLVTTWTGQSAVSGKNVVRTETRSLSPDGKVMTVESVRGSNPSLVMVFEKK